MPAARRLVPSLGASEAPGRDGRALALRFAMNTRFALIGLLSLSLSSALGCATASLSPQGANVAVARSAPAPGCRAVAYLVGEGGGTFGGGWISNDKLIEYAMNDLRNKAAERGATYVQADPPTLGTGKGTTTTVTVTGTAYACATTTQ
jgi:hypothetical protein